MKLLPVLLLLFLAVPATAQDTPCDCGQDLACYETHNYRVGQIRLETLFDKNVPLNFVFNIQKLLVNDFAEIKPKLELKEGEKFTRAAYNNSHLTLAGLLGTPKFGERFKLLYMESSLRDCRTNPLTVDVVYRVFTTDGLSYVTSSFERPNDKIKRAVVIPIPGTDKNKLLPQPYVGFNRSRGIFGGSKADFKKDGGMFNELGVDISGSGSSAVADVELIGSRDYKKGLINHAEWKLAYSYSNIPTDAIRLKDATVKAQFFAGSRPMGPRGLAMRLGVSVEGGNRQADLATNATTLPTNPTDSRYGAIKAYVGTTMNWGRQAWRASYGLQLGQAGKDVRVDYVKHVADTSYSVRILPREHRPLRLDVSASAGVITSRTGLIPVGERFFGGNVRQNFIQGADWEINSGPVIRSFPQNGLNLIGPGLPIGGRKFFSVNLTLAQTIWYHSAIPEELAHNPELRIKLTGSITTERENAKSSYLDLAPEFQALMADLNALEKVLKDINATLDTARAAQPPPPVLSAIDKFFAVDDDSGFKPLPDPLDAINTAKTDKKQVVDQAVALAQDTPELPADSYITVVIKTINAAQASFAAAGLSANDLTKQIDPLTKIQQDIVEKIPKINSIGNYAADDIKLVRDKVNELSPLLLEIGNEVARLPAPPSDDPVKEYGPALDATKLYLAAAKDGVLQVNQDDVTVRGAERLAIGYGEVANAVLTGLVGSMRDLQTALKQKPPVPEATPLEMQTGQLINLQRQIKEQLKKVTVPEIEKRANRDVAFTGRVLDVIFRELNIVALSPLVMVDAARIGPEQTPGFDRVRYGLGGGVRFSLVSLDLDLGYSFNPRRLAGERAGAFVFSMSVSDLFR